MGANLASLLYLVSGILFILALRGLSSPATSRQVNRFGIAGMTIAVVTTLWYRPPADVFAWAMVVVGLGAGAGIGAWKARSVKMTDMPQLVALFHALVGLAAVTTAAFEVVQVIVVALAPRAGSVNGWVTADRSPRSIAADLVMPRSAHLVAA